MRAAVLGWDFAPEQLRKDLNRIPTDHCEDILSAFADVAEMFERRPTNNSARTGGVTGAVSPDMWMETLRQRGPTALSEERKVVLQAAVSHFGIEGLAPSQERDDALMRLARAGLALPDTIPVAIAALKKLESAPIQLLDRLTGLDPSRFAPLRSRRQGSLRSI